MTEKEDYLPFYGDINCFLASIPVRHRTANPLFYCMRLSEHMGDIYKPPFRRGFFFLALLTSTGNTQVTYNDTNEAIKDSFLVFQSPNTIYSFFRDKNTDGYLLYFKEACFDFFKPEFTQEFPFFDPLNTNLFQLTKAEYTKLAPYFEEVFKAYEASVSAYNVAVHKFLVLLYQLKECGLGKHKEVNPQLTAQQILTRKFLALVNLHYLDKRAVEDYAGLLTVSSGYLSKTIKATTGQNALSAINDRIIKEAKLMIKFTELTIAEIAFKLNYSDASNFGNFFRKHVNCSPLSFRNSERIRINHQ
jgi:AraC family transcriptional activator of pobA